MFPDDVYRKQLSDVISELQIWAGALSDCAACDIDLTPAFWKLTVAPTAHGACPFELMLRADQRFNVQIGGEVYEDKPVDAFAFFPMLARAIAAGRVERNTISSALTGAVEAIETRVILEDGWAWIGERRMTARSGRRSDAAQELRTHRFLPYRR
ncbi:MAG TPA: hypothetical protein PLD46_05945 [Hyphomicrobium sp.]|nr:hypothetical protein [Hyphomicrobium sp.]